MKLLSVWVVLHSQLQPAAHKITINHIVTCTSVFSDIIKWLALVVTDL